MGKFYSMKKIRAQNGDSVGRVDIYGEISSVEFWGDEATPSQFIEDLNNLGAVSEIEIFIFSNGGDPFAALAMYSEIKRRSEKVSVYIVGIAASAATLITCAGDPVYIDETAMMMVHNPGQLLCFAMLNAQEARELADELDQIREPMITAYSKKSSKSREEIIALMDGENKKGTWLTASQAIEFGLADAYTPENKKPLEAAAMIKPGVYSYQGHRIDLTGYEQAAEKTAGIINFKREGNSMAISNGRKPKTAAKVKPKAEITFVEMVCPGCNGAVNLNPETGETFAGGAKQEESQDGETPKPSAILARRMPGNLKAEVYTVSCPHCGIEFVWDTDANADGDAGTQTTESKPLGGAAPKPAQQGSEPAPSAEAAQAVCPNCGATVDYDTETAEQGTDDAGTEGYKLTCPECKTSFIEPFASAAADAIPANASAEVKAAYRAGVLAERNRNLALDEMVAAAPGLSGMIQAAKKSGTSVETMGRNVIKAMAAGKGGNNGAAAFANALGNDVRNSGVNNMRAPQHAPGNRSIKESAYDRAIADHNKQREREGGRNDG
jgi:ATP-dependent Clp protease protease subunit